MRVVAQDYEGYFLDDGPYPLSNVKWKDFRRETIHLACGGETDRESLIQEEE
ncbi:hypothetical protein KKC52_12050 [bacterium]|nr:hypothetical protein [bacterium]